jgi:hypothetical protein
MPKATRAKVGAGHCEPFGTMQNCPVVESRDPVEQSESSRLNVTRKAYITPVKPLVHDKGLADSSLCGDCMCDPCQCDDDGD